MEKTLYLVALCIWALTVTAWDDPITVRKFSLIKTDTGENVLNKKINRQHLRQQHEHRSSIDHLTLEFDVDDKHFKFNFQRSYPIFAHDTIKMTGLVRKNKHMPIQSYKTHALM